MDSKSCTKCNVAQPLTNYHIQRMKKDGSLTYALKCKKCKYECSVQDPEFQAKDMAYLLNYSLE